MSVCRLAARTLDQQISESATHTFAPRPGTDGAYTDTTYHMSALEMYITGGQYSNRAGGELIHLNAAFASLRFLKMTRYMLGTQAGASGAHSWHRAARR